MRLFGIIITAGQLAGALTAIGAFLYASWRIYRFCRKTADTVVKTYLSVGVINGDGKTIAENTKDTKKLVGVALSRMDDFALWRLSIDQRMADTARTLTEQNRMLDEIRAGQKP